MSKRFIRLAIAYQVIVTALFLAFEIEFNGQTESQLFRVAIYSEVVVCSWLLAVSALASAVTKRRRGLMRWLKWPPEWDGTVAGWAMTKALFFTVLWLYGIGWAPAEWVLTASLLLFADCHVLFTGQWLGINKRKEES